MTVYVVQVPLRVCADYDEQESWTSISESRRRCGYGLSPDCKVIRCAGCLGRVQPGRRECNEFGKLILRPYYADEWSHEDGSPDCTFER